MIYFISDTHFFHYNIIKYCNRPFATVEEMNERLVENWNAVVNSHDTVFHLGDFSIVRSSRFDIQALYNKLAGKKVLVRGNHDYRKTERLFDVSVEEAVIRVGRTALRLRHIYGADMDYTSTGIFPVFGHYHDTFNAKLCAPGMDYVDGFSGGACVSVEQIKYTPVSADYIIALKRRYDDVSSR